MSKSSGVIADRSEAEAFFKANPDVDSIEMIYTDFGGVPRGKRLRLEAKGREYRSVVVRHIEMSWPLGAASKLDRRPQFVRSMMRYGEARAQEVFRALEFEQAWGARDPDALAGVCAPDAEIGLGAPL